LQGLGLVRVRAGWSLTSAAGTNPDGYSLTIAPSRPWSLHGRHPMPTTGQQEGRHGGQWDTALGPGCLAKVASSCAGPDVGRQASRARCWQNIQLARGISNVGSTSVRASSSSSHQEVITRGSLRGERSAHPRQPLPRLPAQAAVPKNQESRSSTCCGKSGNSAIRAGEVPVTEGARSLEVRWIFPGRLEAAAAGWCAFGVVTLSRRYIQVSSIAMLLRGYSNVRSIAS